MLGAARCAVGFVSFFVRKLTESSGAWAEGGPLSGRRGQPCPEVRGAGSPGHVTPPRLAVELMVLTGHVGVCPTTLPSPRVTASGKVEERAPQVSVDNFTG